MTGVVFLMDLFHIQRRSIMAIPYIRWAPALFSLAVVAPNVAFWLIVGVATVLLLKKELEWGRLQTIPPVQKALEHVGFESKATATQHGSRSAKTDAPTGGEIVDLGRAPYQHQPGNRVSYFITLRQRDQEHTLWGVDLARVVDEHELTSGDCVTLTCQGRQPVKVKDRNGQFKQVHRNTWTATVHSRCYQDLAAQAA